MLIMKKGKSCYNEERVISMMEFHINYIFMEFESILFQQIINIPIGTKCAPLPADLFFSYESKKTKHIISNSDI